MAGSLKDSDTISQTSTSSKRTSLTTSTAGRRPAHSVAFPRMPSADQGKSLKGKPAAMKVRKSSAHATPFPNTSSFPVVPDSPEYKPPVNTTGTIRQVI